MLALSADRRFMLLFACALTAIVALGAVVRGSAGVGASIAADLVPPAGETRIDPPARRTAPLEFPRLLEPLLTTNLTERFPNMASALMPEPSLLLDTQIISYYGNPYAEEMGILGTADLETIAEQLERQAARYDLLNGSTNVLAALHLVYAVAQPHPTDNGLYLQYVDDAIVQRYIEFAEERDMLLFLDLQIGRSSVEAELERVVPYLRHPQVHLAIDPEFAVDSPEVPGKVLGSLRASDINAAQAMLQQLVQAEQLPPKLLIVHQFIDSMVLDGEAIGRYPDVELIIDMDGFGPAEVKRVKYELYAERPYASHAAIKLFFEHDPDLMSEVEILRLEPTPAVVIYQ